MGKHGESRIPPLVVFAALAFLIAVMLAVAPAFL